MTELGPDNVKVMVSFFFREDISRPSIFCSPTTSPTMATTSPATELWVLLKSHDSAAVNNPVKVSTKDCRCVSHFIKAIKRELANKLGTVAVNRITLHLSKDSPALEPDDTLPAQNTKQTALVVTVPSSAPALVSMAYGKAPMSFITEATGIQDENQVWENIPVDTTVEPSPEFVELFKKNCSVFDFGPEASRRTLIDLFLREVVSQFPDFVVVCEYRMSLVNEIKKRRLNGNCDYTICHRGLRNQPLLVAIEAKVTNHQTMLQCIGECASIHYHRKEAGMPNRCVYGIHSTGSIWNFIFVDENGSLFVSKEYHLNPYNYVKEGFDLIYRLVYYVVKQSHINSPRTTPAGSSVSINQ